MKSTIFREILDETTIEVKDSCQETINKLKEQEGICREADGEGTGLRFTCSKKGKLRVDNNIDGRRNSMSDYRAYYVIGEVLEENGKTFVKIYSVYSKSNLLFRLMAIGIYLVAIIACIFAFYKKFEAGEPIESKSVFSLIVAGAVVLLGLLFITRENKHKNADLEIMKNEIKNRVEAIKRWND